MKYIKKLFGGIDLTWKKLLIFSVTAGIIPGILILCDNNNIQLQKAA